MNIAISFVIDKIPLHYYQAELLLYSLEQNTSYKKKNIIVQCLKNVDEKFLVYLQNNDYKYNLINPYLDTKYCNKLQQLKYFLNKDVDGVILIDSDMFILENLSDVYGEHIMAKIVDAPNPMLSTLKNIYTKASLEYPDIVKSDWDIPHNDTFINNFNGGFYYIPKAQINIVYYQWKKWAEWLYSKPNLFENKQQFIHVDQISFSLAIHSNNLEFKLLPSNYNFPIHSHAKTHSIDKSKNIKILHYHREIDNFGYINNKKVKKDNILKSIENANLQIYKKNKIEFFKEFKKSQIQNLKFTEQVISFGKKLESLVDNKRLKLILHAGTPKTGTTSLQFFMDKERNLLEEHKINYPSLYSNTYAPKHQWLVSLLIENNFDELYNYIAKIYNLSIRKNLNTIFLSTEGIYNHWQDYSDEAKTVLSVISKYFHFEVFIFYREPYDFLSSLYQQYLKNPQIKNITCYGKDMPFENILKDSWFIGHADYLSFIYDCEYLFGVKNIKIFKYSDNIIQKVCNELKIEVNLEIIKKENRRLSSISIELLRIINRHDIDKTMKDKIIKELKHADKVLEKYKNISLNNDFTIKEEIKKKFSIQSSILNDCYNVTL